LRGFAKKSEGCELPAWFTNPRWLATLRSPGAKFLHASGVTNQQPEQRSDYGPPDPNSLRPTVGVLLEKEILKDLAVTVSYLGLRRVKVAYGLLPGGAINQPKIYRTGELQEFGSLH